MDESRAAVTAAPIAVVVVNYASHRLLERNLTLAADTRWRVIVVDNFSSDEERAAVQRLAAARGWAIVLRDSNAGFGAAVNVGADRAAELGCSTLLVLNPDAVAEAEVIVAMRAQLLDHPDTLVCPRIVTSSGGDDFRGAWLYLRDGRIRRHRLGEAPHSDRERISWLTGACLGIGLELFVRIGGFDPGYFLYWEDVDLSYRAARAGATLDLRSDLIVVHDEGGTHGGVQRGRAKSSVYYRYNTRNRLRFAAVNLSRHELLRWMVSTPAVSWEILLRGGRRQLIESPRPLLATVRGSVSGLLVAVRALVFGVSARGVAGAGLVGEQDGEAHHEGG